MGQAIPELGEMFKDAVATFQKAPNIMAHGDGYDEENIKEIFEGVGLTSVEFEEVYATERERAKFSLFLAKGVNV